MSAKKRHTANDILDYLKGKSSMKERHEMERSMEADPFEREAMEGLAQLGAEEATEDLLLLNRKLRKRIMRRRRIGWYSIAATAASILILGTVFLQIHDFNPPSEQELQDQMALPIEEETTDIPSEQPLPASEKSAPEKETPKKVESTRKGAPTPARAPAPAPVAHETSAPAASQKKSKNNVRIKGTASRTRETVETYDLDEDEAAGIVVYEAEPGVSVSPSATGDEPLMYNKAEEMALEEVSGVVIHSENLRPLPSATVMVKDADTGVSTDMQGRFSLPVRPDTSTTLLTHFVGMQSGEYNVDRGAELELVMHPDIETLDEVMLVRGLSDDYNIKNENYRAAEPEGGFRAYRKYIQKNLHFPDSALDGKQVVVLSFILTAEGEMKDFIPLYTPGVSFTAEAIRLVKEGPVWVPAENAAGPMNELVRIRIIFKK